MRVRNERLTVILVPQAGARTYTFQVRTGLLAAIAGLLLVLLLIVLTFMFSYGQLFAASRRNSRLQAQVRELQSELAQVKELEGRIAAAEETRDKVLTILGARGEHPDSLHAVSGGAPAAASGSDGVGVREDDFLRSVPRSWPVRGPVTRGFLATGKDGELSHPGIDIAATRETPVRAAAAGTVTFAGWDPEYGYLVVLDHGMGLETRYGHNSRLSVENGDRVGRGQLIAAVGSTGRSTAPHLHFEIRKDGVAVDPRQYLE